MKPVDKQMPKISVVTPSYNQGEYIEDTIVSVIDQGYPNLEYIIMDGGSKDATRSIIEKHAGRIDYWVSEKDAGQSDALRRGFDRASGDIFGWINSDDALAPGALHAIAAAFMSGEADIVAGVVNIRSDGKLVYRHRTGVRAGPLDLQGLLDLRGEWLQGRFFYQPEVYFSRAIYRAAGNTIDTKLHYSMDYDLWVRMAEAGARILPIDYQIANFRMHADQKTSETAAYLPELTDHANAFRGRLAMPVIPAIDLSSLSTKRNLRVGMLNDYGFNYGAGRAHRRIAECLAAHQVDVSFFAFRVDIGDGSAVDMAEATEALQAAEVDVIIVGNLHGAFPEGVALDGLAAVAPLLIVTHDFFWFTGRCPYPMACDAYLFSCPPTCPTRESYPVIPYDDIPAAHQLKIDNLALENVHFLANSDYMAKCARRFVAIKAPAANLEARIRRIRLAVPEECYRPGDRAAARKALDVPPDAFVVLCSSSSVDDQRKGFRHILEACRLVGGPVQVLAMGAVEDEKKIEGVRYTGYLHEDEEIAPCYQAADVFVSGSFNESFGQTFVEAAMCGCPSIGYAGGGIPEAIIPDETGWLVEPNDIAAFAERLRVLVAQPAEEREAFRQSVHVQAASRYGAPSLLSSLDEVFRDVVRDPLATISKSVQFGGLRSLPLKKLTSRRVLLGTGFAPPEGPFPQFGLDDAIAWQISPKAEVMLSAAMAGPHLLTMRVGNLAEGQILTFIRGETIIGKQALAVEEWSVRTEIDIALDLDGGVTVLTIEADRDFVQPDGSRSLYCAFFPARIVPTAVADGLRPLRRTEPGKPAAANGGGPSAPPPTGRGILGRWLTSVGGTRHGAAHARRVESFQEAAARLTSGRVSMQSGFASPEGPFAEFGIDEQLTWQTSKIAEIALTAIKPGPHLLTLRMHNLAEDQTLTVSREGTPLGRQTLAAEDWSVQTDLEIAIDLDTKATVLTLEAERAFVEPGTLRSLYCAYFPPRLKPTRKADGLRPIVRSSRKAAPAAEAPSIKAAFGKLSRSIGPARRTPDPAPDRRLANDAAATPARSPSGLLRPDLATIAGFATVEGPYPSMGVATRLAWQTSARATVELLDTKAAAGDETVAIDLVLPCPQSMTVEIGAASVHFPDLAQSTWVRPTRLLVTPGRLPGGAISLVLDAERHVVDDADRTLYAALLGVSIVTAGQRPADDPYEVPDMTFEVIQAPVGA